MKIGDLVKHLEDGDIAFDGDVEALKNTGDQELRRFISELYVADGYLKAGG